MQTFLGVPSELLLPSLCASAVLAQSLNFAAEPSSRPLHRWLKDSLRDHGDRCCIAGAWGQGMTLYLQPKPSVPAFNGRKEAPKGGCAVISRPPCVLPGQSFYSLLATSVSSRPRGTETPGILALFLCKVTGLSWLEMSSFFFCLSSISYL